MSILQCSPTREVVYCNEIPVTLEGLSLESLCLFLGEQFEQVRELTEGLLRDFPEATFGEGLAAIALQRAPRLVAAMIASSSGNPAAIDHVMTLPAGFQISALATVVRLTLAGIAQETLSEKLQAALAPLLQKPAAATSH